MSRPQGQRLHQELVAALRADADPDRAVHEKRYLRSDLEHLGVSVPAIRGTVKAFSKRHPDLRRGDVLSLVGSLWEDGLHESRMAAVELLDLNGVLLRAEDVGVVERWIRSARTWALVDPLAIDVMGPLIDRHPQLLDVLDRWATDDDFWVRRAALLAQLGPLRKGEGDFHRFARHAEGMLDEREFFIRKAIGWVLRETGKTCPDAVYLWLLPRAAVASGVTVREAVKHLGPHQRDEILEAYRSRREGG